MKMIRQTPPSIAANRRTGESCRWLVARHMRLATQGAPYRSRGRSGGGRDPRALPPPRRPAQGARRALAGATRDPGRRPRDVRRGGDDVQGLAPRAAAVAGRVPASRWRADPEGADIGRLADSSAGAQVPAGASLSCGPSGTMNCRPSRGPQERAPAALPRRSSGAALRRRPRRRSAPRRRTPAGAPRRGELAVAPSVARLATQAATPAWARPCSRACPRCRRRPRAKWVWSATVATRSTTPVSSDLICSPSVASWRMSFTRRCLASSICCSDGLADRMRSAARQSYCLRWVRSDDL